MNLSIIVPVYNSSRFLNSCLDTIMNELYGNDELILVNDGSTDNSLEICEDYAKKDERIRIINNSNHGVSYSRNLGIDAATKDFIMFVDSDDLLVKGWRLIINLIKEDNDITYFSFQFKNQQGLYTKEEILDSIIGYSEKNNLIKYISGPCSKVYSINFLKKNKIYFNVNLINGEDLIFNIEVILHANSFECISKSIYLYRFNTNSSSHTFIASFFTSNEEFLIQLEKILQDNQIDMIKTRKYIYFSMVNSLYLLTNKYIYATSQKEKQLIKEYIKKSSFISSVKKYKIKLSIFNYKIFLANLVMNGHVNFALMINKWICFLRNKRKKNKLEMELI